MKTGTYKSLLVVGCLLAAMLVVGCASLDGSSRTPVGKYGALAVVDGKLVDSQGQQVVLRGMSSMGLQWYGGIVNRAAFTALAKDWEIDVFRLALYVGEDGYASKPGLKDLVKTGIQYAIQHGIYVIVDWHVHNPGNPNDPIYAGAGDFFTEIASEYGEYPNVIYEIMNEPNGNLSWKDDLKPYAEKIVATIRAVDPDNLIIIGSGTWSQDVDVAAADPVVGTNLAYSLHFYAGTHGEELRAKIDKALSLGVAIFSTEWGTSEANGTGGPYIDLAADWLDFLESRGISWVNWSLCNKNETSAALNGLIQGYDDELGPVVLQEEAPLAPTAMHPNGYEYWPEEQLSFSGRFVRARIKGVEPTVTQAEVDAANTAKPVDQPGEFAGLPWNFETGDRQGWSVAVDSPATVNLRVGPAETSALTFRYAWRVPGPSDPWNAAPRVTSSHINIPAEPIKGLVLDFYLEDKEMTGSIQVQPVIQSPEYGYWVQLGARTLNMGVGEPITGADGTALRKFHLDFPVNVRGGAFAPGSVMRNLVLITIGQNTTYSGIVMYDNIEFR